MKTLSTLILIVIFSANALALGEMREIKSAQVKAEEISAKMAIACQASDNQVSAASFAFASYYRKCDELNTSPKLSGYNAQLQILKDNLYEKLQAIFTAEQLRMWTAYKEREGIVE